MHRSRALQAHKAFAVAASGVVPSSEVLRKILADVDASVTRLGPTLSTCTSKEAIIPGLHENLQLVSTVSVVHVSDTPNDYIEAASIGYTHSDLSSAFVSNAIRMLCNAKTIMDMQIFRFRTTKSLRHLTHVGKLGYWERGPEHDQMAVVI